ncbi:MULTISPECIES: YxeA family protein [Virgibacillus]|uniref:YxeA family protein n=1 Tax=Virgibacillus massiliensis TaxID=1462526 RepID=A0A024Q8E2_9BACI|nr:MULTISPECIES: YxeA family protein [Virgibacillus]EQB37962.1 hypothetical protein M948_05180 [Virgibacillus sp. CM-4]CDQ38522.1 hypothetical protein BN990_00792 [Virgibacillus massiliensis]
MKQFRIVCIAISLTLLTACGSEIQTIGSSEYYVKISNKGEKYTEQEHTRYKYQLKGFNEEGNDEKLTFTSNHRLTREAYLRVYFKKGEVITYEEVERDDIPKKPQQLLGVGNDS